MSAVNAMAQRAREQLLCARASYRFAAQSAPGIKIENETKTVEYFVSGLLALQLFQPLLQVAALWRVDLACSLSIVVANYTRRLLLLVLMIIGALVH